MGKVNVYLPDELEQAARDAGLPVSAICQTALRRALVRLAAIRQGERRELTPRLREILDDVQRAAAEAGRQATARDLFGAVVTHGDNLGAHALRSMGVELPSPSRIAKGRSRKGGGELAADARDILAAALKASLEMRHDHVGAEHVVIALAEPWSPLADVFKALGIDQRGLRQHVERLLADPSSHLQPALPGDERTTLERLDTDVQRLAADVERLRRTLRD